MRAFVFAISTTVLLGCVGSDADKGEEEELLDDSKADSQRKPTDHGAIAFAEPGHAALTEAERYHAWQFELSGPASVDLTTSYSVLGQRRTDTVMYLYKEGTNGSASWGPYIARNDDYANTTYSKLVRSLEVGRYRVLVKGFKADTRGKFKVTVNCQGVGCLPPAPAAECLFGDSYNDIEGNPAIEINQEFKVTLANLATLSTVDKQRLVVAVQQSSHTDVTTPEEALDRVDQNEVNIRFMFDAAARRRFVSFEYGAGDNSYGAIFERDANVMVTNIHDGDLENCNVKAESCLLPEDWLVMRNSGEFTRTASRIVTQAGELSAIEAEQALGAFAQSYDDVTTVAEGLDRIDEGKLGIHTYSHPTGSLVDVVEYGAGDTSVGAIYFSGTANRAGIIDDLFITGCALFAK